jgi:death-on-curing protein
MIAISTLQVVEANKSVCLADHRILDANRIESALHSAFYPGSTPFIHGALDGIAGAILFYLTKAHAFKDGNKRTAVLSSIAFLRLNKQDVSVTYNRKTNSNEIAELANALAENEKTMEDAKSWFSKNLTC